MRYLYIDTNIFLNILLAEEEFVELSFKLLQDIENNKYKAYTSFLTLMEIHRILQKEGKKEVEIENAIRNVSNSAVEIILPDSSNILYAYELIKKLKIDPADSIHLAIAQENKTEFVTRDAELSNKIKGMINTYIPEML